MSRSRFLVAVFVLAIHSVPASAVVRTWVSATVGQDANDCSRSAPCRTFSRAITQVDTGGEVVVLDSGGYGPVTINQSVSVISPPGIHAAIAPTAGTAITVDGGSAIVVLRGLYLNGQGASTAVDIQSAFIVHIENVVIHSFNANGIRIEDGTEVLIKDTTVRNCSLAGINAIPTSTISSVVVDRVRLERNGTGLEAESGSLLTVRDSTAVLNASVAFALRNSGALPRPRGLFENCVATGSAAGFLAQSGALLIARNCAAVRNGTGFRALKNISTSPTEIVADRCLASEGTDGFLAGGGPAAVDQVALMTVINSTAANNGSNGIVAGTNGTVRAFGNVATRNNYGLNGDAGTFNSGGHNFSDGNLTAPTLGTINDVATY